MTAKEIAEEGMVNSNNFRDDIESEWWLDSMEHRIKEYARQKCKEQREFCANEMNAGYDSTTNNKAVLTAPEPEFD